MVIVESLLRSKGIEATLHVKNLKSASLSQLSVMTSTAAQLRREAEQTATSSLATVVRVLTTIHLSLSLLILIIGRRRGGEVMAC